jgi:hypothetical protein
MQITQRRRRGLKLQDRFTDMVTSMPSKVDRIYDQQVDNKLL